MTKKRWITKAAAALAVCLLSLGTAAPAWAEEEPTEETQEQKIEIQASADITSCKIGNDKNTVTINAVSQGDMTGTDGRFYLFEMKPYEDEIGSRRDFLASGEGNSFTWTTSLDHGSADDKLYSKFVVAVYDGEDFVQVSEPYYITNPEMIAPNQAAFPYSATKKGLNIELSMLEAQYAQRQSEVAEQLARKKQLDGSLVLETEQRDTAKRLLQRNNYSRMDYLGLEQKIIQTQGEIDMLAAAIPKTQAMMDEARQRIGSRVAEEQLAISQEINKRRTELGSVRESLTAGGDRVTRTEVRSPVRGSVKQILVNTVGGVVKPGEAIMDIVPMDESLLVEVRVRPQDVAFLRPGQDVMIKVSAYDFSIYGGLPGKLESISADTIEDKKGDFYYLVKVRTGETAIRRNDEILPIIPGMIVVADIIIGKKTVLDYILKPVMKARQNALTER